MLLTTRGGFKGGLTVVVAVLSGTTGCDSPPPPPPPPPMIVTPGGGAANRDGIDGVCAGVGHSSAKAYEKDGTHKMLSFRKADKKSFFSRDSSFERWKPESDAEVDLVLCVEAVSRSKVGDCKFSEVDIMDSSKAATEKTLTLNDATLRLTLREAKTAKVLAKKDVELKSDGECPEIWAFQFSGAQKDPDYTDAAVDLSRPFATPGA